MNINFRHLVIGGQVPEQAGIDVALGDIASLEGEPWACGTRSLARRALAELRETAGLGVRAAFEHEFQLPGLPAAHPPAPGAYGFRGFREAQGWAERLIAAMTAAGLGPDTFMKEYGPAQYEVTNAPADGLRAADDAVLLRMLTQEICAAEGLAATFAPILDPASVGNGVHVHLSLLDEAGAPATHDPADPHGLSVPARHFIGGILAHLDQILALLAPSDVSYLRLTPHRWSAAFNNLGYRDREASVRICPVSSADPEAVARQFNFEVRACDAAASPYLVLAALVFAGTAGLRQGIEPPAPTQEDLSLLTTHELDERGFARLPQTLPEALARLEGSEAVRRWFGDDFVDVYLAHKRAELACLDGLDTAARCAKYADVY